MVMIPVPEEHVEEFNRFMIGILMLGANTITAESCLKARTLLTDRQRVLLDVAGAAGADGGQLTYAEVSERTGIALDELYQQILEVNQVFQRHGAPACLVSEPRVTELDDGTTKVEPAVSMLAAVARVLR